ncbi:two-component system, chemotaxis family, sensor kinase CheA [Marinospirillum celere]|uniref:Chemotaxis protein CheA n=1 Tax=Marinospirillum celere TaxID=1122252 RepID=A0A1I1FMG1_9GAMM|nr:chemotaxis protein CheA [Marinospirillum celere]SFC00505.1 two-component system, chemotaxis family, sensor kinase CheA [Marinospirillum celere]
MDDLLKFFVEEANELVQKAGQALLVLEKNPEDPDALTEVFRQVHTLKGSGGVLELHALVKVVHVAEELLEIAKEGETRLDAGSIDILLEAMDQISAWVDALDTQGTLPGDADQKADQLAGELSQVLAAHKGSPVEATATSQETTEATQPEEEPAAATGEGINWGVFEDPVEDRVAPQWLVNLDEAARLEAFRLAQAGETLWVLTYTPDEGCFYQGDDPLLNLRQAPGLLGLALTQWPATTEPESADVYQCELQLGALIQTSEAEVAEHFQYIPEQIDYQPLVKEELIQPQGEPLGMELDSAMLEDMRHFWENRQQDQLLERLDIQLELLNPTSREASLLRWLKEIVQLTPDDALIFETLVEALENPDDLLVDNQIDWSSRLAVFTPQPLEASTQPAFQEHSIPEQEAESESETASEVANQPPSIESAPVLQLTEGSLETQLIEEQLRLLASCQEAQLQAGALASVRHLLANLAQACQASLPPAVVEAKDTQAMQQALKAWVIQDEAPAAQPQERVTDQPKTTVPTPAKSATAPASSARDSKAAAPMIRSYKVDHEQVEQLGDLVGELVVAKNTLPFLAQRAEQIYGQRRIAREIREQFNVINRITRALQDAMMQVQMLPVSHVFQRFPRLVRDLSRKLGKPLELEVKGEDTEAEKHVIENLSDPLIHLMRNSIDHGIEMPEERAAAGKPETGKIWLSAWQENEWVVIEVADDGKGIDPEAMRLKAYEKGLVDERRIKEMTDQEAQELIFAAGFSTKDEATDLSGRGIGMDVVRTTIEKAGGRLELDSRLGEGTRTRMKLPLSMSISQVMQIWIDGQRYGVPMDQVAETVRLPKDRLHQFKDRETVMLREQVLPVCRSRQLLALEEPEDQQQVALLIVRLRGELVALMVDDFSEGVEVILKPMEGALESLGVYQGTALLGDGSVLLVLDLPNLL